MSGSENVKWDRVVKVSVVVPAYNAARFVQATIASVQAQTLRDWELFVVDNGSTDDTGEIARKACENDNRCQVVKVPVNEGVGHGRNVGFSHCGGDFTLFLDADDLLEPTALERLSALLSTSETAVGAHCPVAKFDGEAAGQPIESLEVWPKERVTVSAAGRARVMDSTEATNLRALGVDCWICTPGAVLLRTQQLHAEAARRPDWGGPWRVNEWGCEDLDLWARLAIHGEFLFLPEPLLRYRRHAGTMSNEMGIENVMHREQWLLENDIARDGRDRRAFAAGWRARSYVKYRNHRRWALDSFRARQPVNGARELARAAAALGRYRGLLRIPDWRTAMASMNATQRAEVLERRTG